MQLDHRTLQLGLGASQSDIPCLYSGLYTDSGFRSPRESYKTLAFLFSFFFIQQLLHLHLISSSFSLLLTFQCLLLTSTTLTKQDSLPSIPTFFSFYLTYQPTPKPLPTFNMRFSTIFIAAALAFGISAMPTVCPHFQSRAAVIHCLLLTAVHSCWNYC